MHPLEKSMALDFFKRISVNIILVNRPSSNPFKILSVKNEIHKIQIDNLFSLSNSFVWSFQTLFKKKKKKLIVAMR